MLKHATTINTTKAKMYIKAQRGKKPISIKNRHKIKGHIKQTEKDRLKHPPLNHALKVLFDTNKEPMCINHIAF